MIQDKFERLEEKYILTREQYGQMLDYLSGKVVEDAFSRATVMSLYYDTPDYRIIRHSIEKPVYKEKLRVRCYSVPATESEAFVEIKKKYKGVVYKRRMVMPYAQTEEWLHDSANDTSQIAREIHALCNHYPGIIPSILCSCDRYAVRDKDNEELRFTFDQNLLGRTENLDMRKGVFGEKLLADDHYIMEIKASGAFPLELADVLSQIGIFPQSFSKAGSAYQKIILTDHMPAAKNVQAMI